MLEEEQPKKNFSKFWLLVLLFVLAFLVLKISEAYSKYISSNSSTINKTVATWKLKITNGSGSESNVITPVLLTTTNVASGTIAPGSIGYFDIIIDPTSTEVSFKYNINFSYSGSNIGDFQAVKYKLTENNTFDLGTASSSDIDAVDATDSEEDNIYHVISGNSIPDVIKLYSSSNPFTKINIRVYFMWIEGTGESMTDANDTTVGDNTTTQYGKVTVTINAEQYIPSDNMDSLDQFIERAKAGDVDDDDINTEFTINMGSTYGNQVIRVANVNSPAVCDALDFSQTACGVVMEFKGIVTEEAMNSTYTNVGGWPSSDMYDFVNEDIYEALPSNLQSAIIDTTVVSGHGWEETSNFT